MATERWTEQSVASPDRSEIGWSAFAGASEKFAPVSSPQLSISAGRPVREQNAPFRRPRADRRTSLPARQSLRYARRRAAERSGRRAVDAVVYYDPAQVLLPDSDFVMLGCPLTRETEKLTDGEAYPRRRTTPPPIFWTSILCRACRSAATRGFFLDLYTGI